MLSYPILSYPILSYPGYWSLATGYWLLIVLWFRQAKDAYLIYLKERHAICHLLYAIRYMLYAICFICYILYAICYMLYAICYMATRYWRGTQRVGPKA